jgi:predicted  nucleic acid-binding Zn-ribbon protein
MNEEVIARMRDRIDRVRKVIDRAHDPEMIAMLRQMISEAEADIRKLEAEEEPVQTITPEPPREGS